MSLSKIDFEKLNLQDALDLAVLIENEAFERYTEFAEQVGHRYDGDSGDFFKTMAGYEAEHADQLKARREKLYGKSPSRVNADMIWDIEAPSEGAVRSYMSPKQAMEVAMESEVKAYNFFDKALAFVKDAEVKKLFEELRAEEQEHKDILTKQMAKTPSAEGPDLTDDDIDEPGEF